jgi:hypothetical protein
VQGSGSRVQGLKFSFWGLILGIRGSWFAVKGQYYKDNGWEFGFMSNVHNLGCGVKR